MENQQYLAGKELDSKILDMLGENQPIKAHIIYEQLTQNRECMVRSHEVARSVWRLVDDGKARVRAGEGVSLRNGKVPQSPFKAK